MSAFFQYTWVVTLIWRFTNGPKGRKKHYTAQYCVQAGERDEAIRKARASVIFTEETDHIVGTAHMGGSVVQMGANRLCRFNKWDMRNPELFIRLPRKNP